MPMPRIMLTIEYEGTHFLGWQLQAEGRTVQGVVEQAVERATTVFSRVTGASRTDSGVHALGQVAHFDTDTRLPPRQLLKAVNHWLPPDVAVLDCRVVPPEFHARFSPSTKLYRYRILQSPVRRPHREPYVLRERHELDVEAMRTCAAMLLGRHDFTSFCSEQAQVDSRVRRIGRSELQQAGDELHYVVEADGFLYKMVRIVVGTLMRVGRCDMTPAQFGEALAARSRKAAGPTAPARALTLMRVAYKGDPRGERSAGA